MNDVAERYAPLIQQIADLHADDADLCAYLTRLRVNREEWDTDRCGGHFWFDHVADDPGVDLVEATAQDADGAAIEIILHFIGSRGIWAEWYRSDGKPILRWPPF